MQLGCDAKHSFLAFEKLPSFTFGNSYALKGKSFVQFAHVDRLLFKSGENKAEQLGRKCVKTKDIWLKLITRWFIYQTHFEREIIVKNDI